MSFVMRKLDRVPKTLGEKLRALRRGQAVSLAMMERATHIQHRYLEALERGRYERLPEPLYTRNFLRAYARVLGADEHYFIELYDEECGRCDLISPMQSPRQRTRRSKFFVWHRLIKVGAVGSIVLMLLGYLALQVRAILAPPEIVLLTPVDAMMTDVARVKVQGFVQGEATVYVNGEQVAVDADRLFRAEVELEKGLNTIVIEAERRYSRRATLERQVFFNPSAQVSLLQ